MRPIAKLKESPKGRPATSQRRAGTRARRRGRRAAISQATRRTSRSSGLCSVVSRWASAAIRPSSVRMPVAKTSARASPPMHVVPLKTRSRASISGPVVSIRSAERYTGCDSPVSAERSSSTPPVEQPGVGRDRGRLPEDDDVAGHEARRVDVLLRPVADRRSPGAGGSGAAPRPRARPGVSCMNAKPALRTTTTTIAIPSGTIPATKARADAAQRSNARGWLTWRTICAGQWERVRRSRTFGP